MPRKIPEQEIADDLRRVASSLNRAPLTAEYEMLGKISTITIRKRFGGWEKALLYAGLSPTELHKHMWSDEEIDKETLAEIRAAYPLEDELKVIRETFKLKGKTFDDFNKFVEECKTKGTVKKQTAATKRALLKEIESGDGTMQQKIYVE